MAHLKLLMMPMCLIACGSPRNRALRFSCSLAAAIIPDDASELSTSAAIRLLGDPMVMQSAHADLLAGVFGMGYDAVSAAKQVGIPALTIVAGRDDLISNACVYQLHANLAGRKSLFKLKTGPHLLLHWRHGGVVLRRARRWIEAQLAQTVQLQKTDLRLAGASNQLPQSL